MINKELFVTVIHLIQEQEKVDSKFSKALELVCDNVGIVYGTGNKLHQAVFLLLEDWCNDVGQYISWWLYEDVDHVVHDETHEWHLNTIEDLYEFIVENQNAWKAIRRKNQLT